MPGCIIGRRVARPHGARAAGRLASRKVGALSTRVHCPAVQRRLPSTTYCMRLLSGSISHQLSLLGLLAGGAAFSVSPAVVDDGQTVVEIASFEHGVALWQPTLWGNHSHFDVKHWTTEKPVCSTSAVVAESVNSTSGLDDNANSWRCAPDCGLCNLTLVLTTPQLSNASTQGYPSCPTASPSPPPPGWRGCIVSSYDWSRYDAMTVKWDAGPPERLSPSRGARFFHLAIEVGIGSLNSSTGLPAADTDWAIVYSHAVHFSPGMDTTSLAYAPLDLKLPNRSSIVAIKFVVWPFNNGPGSAAAAQTTRVFSIKLINNFWPAKPEFPSRQRLTIADAVDSTTKLLATSQFLGTVYYDNDGRYSPSGFFDKTMVGAFGKPGVHRIWAGGGEP